MIIVKLMGGIGNQMFQYATGRAVAYHASMPLKLDITYFERYKLRSYQLGYFNIQEDFASIKEIKSFKKPNRRKIIAYAHYKVGTKLLPRHRQKLIKQRGRSYDPDVVKIKRSAYLDGYWQSEKYFADISDVIRREFTVKNEPDGLNSQLLTEIEGVNSVSMHVRRGDYLSNPQTLKTHGILSLDYYVNAVDMITEKIEKPHFFIFSDDIPWVRKNLKISFPTHFISHNGANKDYEDLRLMSRCKHHIIANSSFSWWGAWLSDNPEKNVIAPKSWFADKTLVSEDIYVNTWIKL